jgi:polysaccharide biosynthesis transport protein
VTDAAVLAQACDGAVLVARHGRTSREQAAKAVRALQAVNARLLGTVLTMVPGRRRDAGYTTGYYYRTDEAAGLLDLDRPAEPARAQAKAGVVRTPAGTGRRR